MKMRLVAWMVMGMGWGGWQAVASPPLRVGVFAKAPYAEPGSSGLWRGLAVEYWEQAAARARLDWEWVVVEPDSAFNLLETGKLDALVGEISLSASLEKRFDFVVPWLVSSTGFVVKERRGMAELALLETFFSWEFARLVLGLLIFLLLCSVAVWLAERNHHTSHFAGTILEGLGQAIWFVATTITTVGYGDKTPQTPRGRAIVILLMFCGLLIVAGFTGAVASLATSARMHVETRELANLAGRPVGVLGEGESRAALKSLGIHTVGFPTWEEALGALSAGRIAGVAADRNLLAWHIQHHELPGLRLLPERLGEFFLAVALPLGSPHRKALNVATLEVLESADWKESVEYWLGTQEARSRCRFSRRSP